MKTVHIRIEGRVQGVFFRDFTRKKARELSLSGWVRNTEDGAVEGVFQGEEASISAMTDWLHTGSPHSSVTDVIVNKYQSNESFLNFQIRY